MNTLLIATMLFLARGGSYYPPIGQREGAAILGVLIIAVFIISEIAKEFEFQSRYYRPSSNAPHPMTDSMSSGPKTHEVWLNLQRHNQGWMTHGSSNWTKDDAEKAVKLLRQSFPDCKVVCIPICDWSSGSDKNWKAFTRRLDLLSRK